MTVTNASEWPGPGSLVSPSLVPCDNQLCGAAWCSVTCHTVDTPATACTCHQSNTNTTHLKVKMQWEICQVHQWQNSQYSYIFIQIWKEWWLWLMGLGYVTRTSWIKIRNHQLNPKLVPSFPLFPSQDGTTQSRVNCDGDNISVKTQALNKGFKCEEG